MQIEQLGSDGPRVAILSWAEIDNCLARITEGIRGHGFAPEVIVGIARGGCIPAVWLSHSLACDNIYFLRLRTTLSNEVRAQRTIRAGNIWFAPHIRNKRILLVDDVVNTGTSMRVARNQLLKYGSMEIVTAAIAWDTVGGGPSAMVDLCCLTIDAWVVFPWETNPKKALEIAPNSWT